MILSIIFTLIGTMSSIKRTNYDGKNLNAKKIQMRKKSSEEKRNYFQRKKEMNDIYLKCFDFCYLFSLMQMHENRNSFSIVKCECLVEH